MKKIAASDIKVVEIDPSDLAMLRKIGQLRVEAWATVIPDSKNMDLWLDEYDLISRHWTVLLNGELVAAARMSVHNSASDLPDRESFADELLPKLPTPIASFNRLVVLQAARGLGIAKRIDSLRVYEAEQMGCRCVIGATPSGEARIRQLTSVGFELVGKSAGYRKGPFAFRPTVDEAVMVCYLPRKG